MINNNKKNKKDIILTNLNDRQNLILIKLKNDHNSLDNEKVGAKFLDFIKENLINDVTFLDKIF